jgi:hypothetical protein
MTLVDLAPFSLDVLKWKIALGTIQSAGNTDFSLGMADVEWEVVGGCS